MSSGGGRNQTEGRPLPVPCLLSNYTSPKAKMKVHSPLVGIGLQQGSSRVSCSVLNGMQLRFEVTNLCLSGFQLQLKASQIVLCRAFILVCVCEASPVFEELEAVCALQQGLIWQNGRAWAGRRSCQSKMVGFFGWYLDRELQMMAEGSGSRGCILSCTDCC